MDEQQRPIPCDSLQTRIVRFATVVLCALLCSAVVGAVGVKPKEARRAVETPPVRPFVPVEMVPVVVRAKAAPLPSTPPATITATSELLRPVGDTGISASNVKPILPPLPAAPLPKFRVLRMEVTAYCHCTKCCGPAAQGITASGKPVSYNNGLFVAADTSVLPFGSRLVIPGYAGNQPVEVIDRGGAIKGKKLDLYYASHDVAREWGRRFVDVIVLE